MRDYGKITPGIWTGKTGRQLRKNPDAQITALYLMTSPHANMIGLYYCPVAYIMADTGLSEEGASKGLQRLCELGFCKYDWESEWVWVKEMARFQIEEQLKPGDKRISGIHNELSRLPNAIDALKQAFIEKYQETFHLSAPEKTSPPEAPSKPLRSQEQEQEQEQEQKKDPSTDVDVRPLAAASGPAEPPRLRSVKPPCPFDAIRELYHEILPELRQCRVMTDTRKGYIRQRWNDWPGPDLERWRKYFGYVRDSQFLMGKKGGHDGRPPFECDLEWLTKPGNCAKVREGKYHHHEVAARG